jgi:hypothetical protein
MYVCICSFIAEFLVGCSVTLGSLPAYTQWELLHTSLLYVSDLYASVCLTSSHFISVWWSRLHRHRRRDNIVLTFFSCLYAYVFIHSLFRTMGMRHVLVVDGELLVKGIITRADMNEHHLEHFWKEQVCTSISCRSLCLIGNNVCLCLFIW